MTTKRMSGLLLLLLAFAWLPRAHADECRSVAARYEQFMFPQLLSGLDKSCITTLDQKEQLFVAGLTQYFVENCNVSTQARLKLQKFLSSSALAGTIGRQYGNPDLGKGLGDQMTSGTAYASGASVAKEMGCAYSKPLTNGVLSYLDRTSAGETGKGPPRYVTECARYYAGRYTQQQCQCVADIGRSIYPDIHASSFSPESIKNIIQSNPFY
jgi:hypothetical protein